MDLGVPLYGGASVIWCLGVGGYYKIFVVFMKFWSTFSSLFQIKRGRIFTARGGEGMESGLNGQGGSPLQGRVN